MTQTIDQIQMTGRGTYLGVFLITLSTLMYEILLTRFFSVMMWYHFSFVAISVAMFGMTLGAVIVYLFPNYFRPELTSRHMSIYSAGFAVTVVTSSLSVLCIPVMMQPPGASRMILWVSSLASVYVISAIPLVMSGIVVCLALTRFPRSIGHLYAADLAGAAAGCIALVLLLKMSDGPTAIFCLSLLSGVAALAFAGAQTSPGYKKAIGAILLLSGLVFVGNSFLAAQQKSLFGLIWVKGRFDEKPLYEKWNSFSRVAVYGNPVDQMRPAGWGLSPTFPREYRYHHLYLDIDASASTLLPRFRGDFAEVDYLKCDMVQLAHHIRNDANVLVMGAGGGSDILTALMFNQKSVTGVEINENIFHAVNRAFGDFTGHLDRDPRVTLVVDDARSYITRQTNRYDIIQASLVDSFAATAAGAFTLTENALYTTDAWKTFFHHLTPQGILTFSRVYVAKNPGEVYRLLALATATLREAGIPNPREHLFLTKLIGAQDTVGTSTILVSHDPFSQEDLDELERTCSRLAFQIILSPRTVADANLATIVNEENLTPLGEQLSLNIQAPTDDVPFFFHMLRLQDVFKPQIWLSGPHRTNLVAPVMLITLLLIVTVLTVVGIVVPLRLKMGQGARKGSPHLLFFFAAIGMGFMLVEVSQMQRLSVFLGHPVYGLGVALFSLLLSAGIGSFTVNPVASQKQCLSRIAALLVVLCLYALVIPWVFRSFAGSITPVRIAVAILALGSIGFFMGMTFPIGMKLASVQCDPLKPMLWGINGATSVVASVLAILIAMNWGITVSFLTGLFFYFAALLAFLVGCRQNRPSLPTSTRSA